MLSSKSGRLINRTTNFCITYKLKDVKGNDRELGPLSLVRNSTMNNHLLQLMAKQPIPIRTIPPKKEFNRIQSNAVLLKKPFPFLYTNTHFHISTKCINKSVPLILLVDPDDHDTISNPSVPV